MELLHISYCREKESIERLYFLTGVELFSEYLILSLFYIVLHDLSDNRLKDTIISEIAMFRLDLDIESCFSFWSDMFVDFFCESLHTRKRKKYD